MAVAGPAALVAAGMATSTQAGTAAREGEALAETQAQVRAIEPVLDGNTQTEVPKKELESCVAAQKKAQLACATLTLTGMDPGTAAMTEMMLMQSLQMISQMKSQGSAAQCKSQQDLNKIMTMISAAKTAACLAMMNSCNKSCTTASTNYRNLAKAARANQSPGRTPQPNETVSGTLPENETRAGALERSYARSAERAMDQCGTYKGNMAMMIMQTMQGVTGMALAGKCQDNLATNPNPIASATPFAIPTPGPGDCSDPKTASMNIACICQNDPNNQMCKGGNAANVFGGGGSTVGGGPGTPSGGIPGMGDLGSDGEIAEEGGAADKQRGASGPQDGGGGGLGGGGGSGFGNGFDQGDGNGGPSGIDKNVITGQSGGNGSGSSGGFAATSGGSGGGRGSGGSEGSSGGGGFNLKDYLPKNDYKARGLAGMSIEAKDGVTGPMGPSIWEKVSNQYQTQKPTLFQDR